MTRYKNKKAVLMIASTLILLTAIVGSTAAYIKSTAEPIENTFAPARVSCEVTETFDGKTKEHVGVKNTGNVNSYIRATVTIGWQIDTGANVILATQPEENTDYKIVSGSSKWNKGTDGYWYYADAISPESITEDLFSSVVSLTESPAGYKLSFNIICEAIQSEPTTAVSDAWDVTLINGQIFPAP